MSNQFKHDAVGSVQSQYNPVAVLKPDVRRVVNAQFIKPILDAFFAGKGGIENFHELDHDKLLTEIEFNDGKWNFVKEYIYKELAESISKSEDRKVLFKPRYLICFDEDLANYKTDSSKYPYKLIFGLENKQEGNIKYGVVRLGEAIMLYYIFIDFQEVIRFIKTIPRGLYTPNKSLKPITTEYENRINLINGLIIEKQLELSLTNKLSHKTTIGDEISRLENLKTRTLEGGKGKLRVNLTWSTTDDLDLHVFTPSGEISYSNNSIEHEGVIGQLDVDKNAGNELVSNPQENISFDAIPIGKHLVVVKLFKVRDSNSVPFILTITTELEGGKILNGIVAGEKSKREVSFEFQEDRLFIGELS
ncbi:hypothetical protein [Hymenobacter canadensis]|uniref:Uncharacterized protein n=1 Tax=Hymenobacter canadensis TaxID=2999067 RepID=A0ABY7LYM0_9BACT|nr:hypothetical protein [Hymenobacter canadensis]WBA44048.1 hypothetical protein O3303_21030 [Hymenobacter canadensis]